MHYLSHLNVFVFFLVLGSCNCFLACSLPSVSCCHQLRWAPTATPRGPRPKQGTAHGYSPSHLSRQRRRACPPSPPPSHSMATLHPRHAALTCAFVSQDDLENVYQFFGVQPPPFSPIRPQVPSRVPDARVLIRAAASHHANSTAGAYTLLVCYGVRSSSLPLLETQYAVGY